MSLRVLSKTKYREETLNKPIQDVQTTSTLGLKYK